MLKRSLLVLLGLCVASIANAVDVPRPAPDFTINMVDGQPIPLSQYKGKICVLAFILTTCPHCQKTVGILSQIQKEYGPRGVQVIASAIDDLGKMNVPDFVKTFHPTFPIGYTPQNDADGFLQNPVIYKMYVPQLVFIDKQGTIRAQHPGEDKAFWDDQEKHIREEIEALLKEPPSPHKRAK
ncbi:MAG: TlpA disulfide reductase family protein [Bryobacteraceae bacterium]